MLSFYPKRPFTVSRKLLFSMSARICHLPRVNMQQLASRELIEPLSGIGRCAAGSLCRAL